MEKEVKDKEKKDAKDAKEAKEAKEAASGAGNEEDAGAAAAKASPAPKLDLGKARTERHIEAVNSVVEPIVEQVWFWLMLMFLLSGKSSSFVYVSLNCAMCTFTRVLACFCDSTRKKCQGQPSHMTMVLAWFVRQNNFYMTKN